MCHQMLCLLISIEYIWGFKKRFVVLEPKRPHNAPAILGLKY